MALVFIVGLGEACKALSFQQLAGSSSCERMQGANSHSCRSGLVVDLSIQGNRVLDSAAQLRGCGCTGTATYVQLASHAVYPTCSMFRGVLQSKPELRAMVRLHVESFDFDGGGTQWLFSMEASSLFSMEASSELVIPYWPAARQPPTSTFE